MAETTAIDQAHQNGDSQYHQPRARKPAHIGLLRAQHGSEEGNKLNIAQQEAQSRLSR
jgi:sterol O-acyltransferase